MESTRSARLSTRQLTLCGLLAACTAIGSQLVIPLQPVPINLALLPVLLAGALLGPVNGFLSQLAYLLLGAVGAPVFSGFRGGLGTLMGPTGGYLIGYLAAALLTGLLAKRGSSPLRLGMAMAAGVAACYLFGTGWFCLVTGRTVVDALAVCVLPFLPGDLLKIVAAVVLTRRLTPHLSH